MSATIRLSRYGRAKRPFYRLVVVDSRVRRDGAYLEKLGVYNPIPAQFEVEVNASAAIEWLNKGATMTDTARSLLRNQGVLYRWHLEKSGTATAEVDEKVAAFVEARSQKVVADKMKVEQARQKKRQAEADAIAAKQKAEQEAAAAAAAEAEATKKAEADAAKAEATAKAEADAAPESGAKEVAEDAAGDAEGEKADDGEAPK